MYVKIRRHAQRTQARGATPSPINIIIIIPATLQNCYGCYCKLSVSKPP